MSPPQTDAEIMVGSVDQPEQFGAIFDRHAAAIHAYLVRRLGTAHAETTLGETFRVAFERRDTFRPDRTDARPWLYGIAANLVLQHLRREGRQRATAERLRYRSSTSGSSDDAGDGERITERLDAAERWPAVVRALDSLEPRDREVVLLYAWEELTYAEIAEAMAIPVGTVRSRLSRARRLLRELLPDQPKPSNQREKAPR